MTRNEFRQLPSVDQFLRTPSVIAWLAEYGRPLVLKAVREALEDTRERIKGGNPIPSEVEINSKALEKLKRWVTPSLETLINATGVVLHTSLGRAPLSRAAQKAVQDIAADYSNLEFDLSTGKRGSRLTHAANLLTQLTGAEDALVVNNNAAGVLLVLSALARSKRVVVARSQMVEIGGGFRIPDVMRQSGARLVEIGTTNRIHISDYQEALADPVAVVLHTNPSNFRIVGFTSSPDLVDIANLAHEKNVPVVYDLGSGALLDTTQYGLEHEPMVQEALAAGVDIVCFSGDKLMGGPQSGLIVGKENLLAKIKKHPLARAVRVDKLCLAALSATILHYLKDEAVREVPVWQMIAARPDQLRARVQSWVAQIGRGELVAGRSTVGGGSLPGETLPTTLLSLAVPRPDRFLTRLRAERPLVIARLEDNRVLFDPRTVLPEQEAALIAGILKAF